jgi:hypothetical protein
MNEATAVGPNDLVSGELMLKPSQDTRWDILRLAVKDAINAACESSLTISLGDDPDDRSSDVFEDRLTFIQAAAVVVCEALHAIRRDATDTFLAEYITNVAANMRRLLKSPSRDITDTIERAVELKLPGGFEKDDADLTT